MKIDWLEGGDPLSPAFFKKTEEKAVATPGMVKEAGRKYAQRIQKRLSSVRVDCLRRVLKEELARAERQQKDGIYIAREEGKKGEAMPAASGESTEVTIGDASTAVEQQLGGVPGPVSSGTAAMEQ